MDLRDRPLWYITIVYCLEMPLKNIQIGILLHNISQRSAILRAFVQLAQFCIEISLKILLRVRNLFLQLAEGYGTIGFAGV